MRLDRIIAVRNDKTVYKDRNRCLKVFRSGYSKADVLSEALNQARAEQAGIPVPKIREIAVIDGKWTIVSDYVTGKTLARLLVEEKEKKKESTELFVDLQIDLFSKKCPLLTNLRDKMRRKIAETGLDEELCSRLYERLEALPEHDKLCHGDFDLSNVILTDEGTPCILDWAHATIGNASADVAQTYLLFRLKGDIPGAENYLKLFCQKTGTAREYVEKWMPIVAACRMAKCNEKERGVLYSWVNAPDKY